MKRREFISGAAGAISLLAYDMARASTKPCPPGSLGVGGGSSVAVDCSPIEFVGAPAWLQGRQINEWFQIPGTAMSSCPPTTQPFYGRASAKMDAWCGAALRRLGSIYLIGAGGGHGDYTGNEVNALTLESDTPRWVELRPSSPLSVVVNSAGVYTDCRRSATHTYYASHFINQDDRLAILPSEGPLADSLPNPSPEFRSAYSSSKLFCSFAASDWTASAAGNDWDADKIASTGSGHYANFPGGGSFIAALGCMDSSTGDLYHARDFDDGRLWKWTRASNSWTELAKIGHQGYAGSAIDHSRNPKRMLVVGDYSGTLPPRVYRLDTGEKLSVRFVGLGSSALQMSGYPGVVYDELNDRFLVFRNTSPMSAYAVDPETWEVSALQMNGSPAARPQGLHNSIQFVPHLRGLVMGHSYTKDVYFMRLG